MHTPTDPHATADQNAETPVHKAEVKTEKPLSVSSIKLQKQPSVGVNTEAARLERLAFLEANGHASNRYEASTLSARDVKGNIESFLGAMTLPVGLVGPMLFTNAEGKCEQVFAAAATTEGALVASMNRGVSVMNETGGFQAHVNGQRMLRAPMFCFENLTKAIAFRDWLSQQLDFIRTYIKQYSSHAVLTEIKTDLLSKNLMCQFYYETGDASGQNMTTICTWQACVYLERAYSKVNPGSIRDFILDCNGSADKKISHDSLLNGRGVDVVAECLISEEVLRRKLKTSSKEMLSWYNRSTYVAQVGGMIGYNVNVANPIAAIFAATGQDLACVHESAVGFLYFEPDPKGLYVSLKLPRLVLATIGGGTSLPFQRTNLALMGCEGTGKVNRFAKLLAGLCLGLELSTFATMSNGQFAIAHERLGRNKPLNPLNKNPQDPDFIHKNLLINKSKRAQKLNSMSESNGILTELASQASNKELGLSLWEISDGQTRALSLLKSKPSDRELLNCMYVLTGLIDPRLARTFDAYKDQCDFRNAHHKELALFKAVQSKHMPKLYGTYCDNETETFLLMMALLPSNEYRVMNSEMQSDLWDDDTIKAMINASISLQEAMRPLQDDPLFSWSPKEDYLEFGTQALSVLRDEYGHEWSAFFELYETALKFLRTVDESSLPKTLIHNDFNPRNIAISHTGHVMVYDFELARVDVPHRDIVECLSFVLNSNALHMTFVEMMALYETQMGIARDADRTIWKFALCKYLITRVSLYLLGNRITQYPFLNHVVNNCLSMGSELGLS